MRRIAATFALLTLAGCASVQIGRDFDLAGFESKVERGVTTQAQVRGWLGAPNSIGVSVDPGGNKFTEWSYYYGAGRLPNVSGAKLKILQVKFDDRGVVRAYNWSAEAK